MVLRDKTGLNSLYAAAYILDSLCALRVLESLAFMLSVIVEDLAAQAHPLSSACTTTITCTYNQTGAACHAHFWRPIPQVCPQSETTGAEGVGGWSGSRPTGFPAVPLYMY